MSTDKIINLLCIGGIILGIRWMNSPKTARTGNLIGAVSLFAAILATLICRNILTHSIIWISIGLGAVLGGILAVSVQIIQMPQLVGLLNGLGGGASALVAFLVLCESGEQITGLSRAIGVSALTVGGVTFSGSLIAAGKLHGKLPSLPVILRGHFLFVLLTVSALGILFVCVTSGFFSPLLRFCSILLLFFSLLLGVLIAIRVGGGDMPITISLLNSLSGVSAAIVGLATADFLSVAVGAIVGSAGLVLTQIMCRAMNSSILRILAGKTAQIASTSKPRAEPAMEAPCPASPDIPQTQTLSSSVEEAVRLIRQAERIIIVPGYGMALAQAQFRVKELVDQLTIQNKSVKFAIHPVAGRMPGHMYVLLAEAEIPYDILHPMEAINSEFQNTQVVLVVGANDVINPAARTAEGTPIFGMPVLNVDQADHVIICNKDDRPGYAGVANPLYTSHNKATLLWGDAAEILGTLLNLLKGEAPYAAG